MKISLLAILISCLCAQSLEAETLSEYLQRVKSSNSRFRANDKFVQSSELSKSAVNLLTSVRLFSSLDGSIDKKESTNYEFEGTKRSSTGAKLGLEQVSDWGIEHRVYAQYSYLDINNAPLLSNPEASNTSLVYEFNVPLLKNKFGKVLQLQKEEIIARSDSEKFQNQFELRKILVDASSTYWRLKTSQEIVKSLDEVIEKGNGYISWTKKRVNDRLSEDSDLRQAEAMVALHQVDLKKELKELEAAKRQYNSYLEIDLSSSVDNLENFPQDSALPTIPSIEAALNRPDILSLEAQLKQSSINSNLLYENSLADLDIYGAVGTSGQRNNAEPEWSKTTSGKYPNYSIGVKFSIPLDQVNSKKIADAKDIHKSAVEYALKRNTFESVSSLKDLKLSYEDQVDQLKYARILENAQKKKLETERARSRTGRTSTFQVLSFEQDYQNSRQDLIRTQGQLWQLSAQTFLFLNNEQE